MLDGVIFLKKYEECRECVSAADFLVEGLIPLLIPPPLNFPNRLVDDGKMIEADTEIGEKGGQDDGEPDLSDSVVCPQNNTTIKKHVNGLETVMMATGNDD